MLGVIAGGLAAVAIAVGVVAVMGRGPGPSTLVVRSEPRGAAVFLDGRDSGERTPALLKGVLSQEPHKLRLVLPGHVPLDEIVTIPKAGMTWEVSFTLAPEPR
jgi:hypothetical protein